MLETIQLQNFIAHPNTSLKLDEGLVIFIGHNGAGKSSVIDAVTYALYGQHTRKSNKNLVRRGSNNSLVDIEFSVRGRKYKVSRATNASGQLVNAKLTEVRPTGLVDIVVGERRQFSESVSDEIGKILGVDYSKLKVAAIVQQGELDAILRSQPKEFKELINSLFGLDKLDFAYQSMKELLDLFRSEVKKKVGYDDSDLESVKARLEISYHKREEKRKLLAELQKEKTGLAEKIARLEDLREELEPLIMKMNELQKSETLLVSYVEEKRSEIERFISNSSELIKRAKESLTIIEGEEHVEKELASLQSDLSEIERRLQDTSNDIGKIRGLLDVGSKLRIVDGKCPVCDTPVSKINEIYDVPHLKRELAKAIKEQEKLNEQKNKLEVNEGKVRKKEMAISNAKSFLENNRIEGIKEIHTIEREVFSKKAILATLPSSAHSKYDPEKFAFDEYSRKLSSEISRLHKETETFNESEYQRVKNQLKNLLSEEMPELEGRIGECRTTVMATEKECDDLQKAVQELEKAHEYVKIFERIRNSVYNRDGDVGMSLRTWALRTMSEKASEYTGMFNLSISRVQLTEKAREISIECYGRSGAIDMESLSGGEKVAIALALRLAIAYVMGSGKIDFVILDEPTTHLDEERRKSLVRIITEAFRSGLGPLSQMILITHDSEIFENAEADSVYKFSMTNSGTEITKQL